MGNWRLLVTPAASECIFFILLLTGTKVRSSALPLTSTDISAVSALMVLAQSFKSNSSSYHGVPSLKAMDKC